MENMIGWTGLSACAEQLTELVGGVCHLSVRNTEGDVLWHYSPSNKIAVDLPLWHFPGDSEWQELDSDVFMHQVDRNRELFVCTVKSGDVENPIYLYLLYQPAPTHASTNRDSVLQALRNIGRMMSSIYSLNNELDSMTDELTRRYEELNLVYDTDEDVRFLDDRQDALNNIVENCIDYLNVDVAVLYLLEKTSPLIQTGDKWDNSISLATLGSMDDEVGNWMSRINTSIVLNTPEERAVSSLDFLGENKLVACPLRDAQGRLRGTLVVINSAENRDFENGDRNLLTVMARKASSIVRANYDELTGLITREGFEQAVTKLLPQAKSDRQSICLLHANIDQLHLVNDTFGHETGDSLIQQIALILQQQLRANDYISRLGGDEFGIILANCTLQNAKNMADRVCEVVSQIECQVDNRRLDVGISIGVSQLESSSDSVIGAMAAADLACSVAKENGRNCAFVFQPDDKEMHTRKHQMHWVSKIQNAIKLNEFELFSQIIQATDSTNGSPHYEILLRMKDPNGQIVSPGLFLPVAERYHLMPSIDRWVIEHSLAILAQWRSAELIAQSVFTINLSGESLTDERTLTFLVDQLQKTTVNTGNICFEITESEAIRDLVGAQHFIATVKNFGCRFALDDFGSGVSSFTNLKELDLDYLKIDGSFVVDMLTDPISAAMVTAINQVGQTMNLKTVAEFVESSEVKAALCKLGVNYLQGYDIGKPRPLIDQLHELASARACIA